MNILRIVYDWPDENVITEGLAPAPYELSLSQTRLNNTVYVLCGNLNGKNLKKLNFSYSLNNNKVFVYNLPRALKYFGPFLTTSVFVLPFYFYLKITKRIDIVHNHGHLGVWFLLYKYLFKFIDKTPVIGHFHNTAKGREQAILLNGGCINFFSKCFEYPIHKFSDYLMVHVCNHIVMVSKGNIEELVNLYKADPNKISLLESGVDTKRFIKKGAKEDFGFNENDIILGNGGRLSKRKNIDILVKSLCYLPDQYKLVLWGPWDTSFKNKVQKIIDENGLKDRVKYLGVISYFRVDSFYRSCDLFLLPSSYEGLPKVVIEALNSGCKVIASGFETDKDIPNLYFLNKIKPSSIANNIKIVYSKPSKYEKTRSIIEKYYSWDSKARLLAGIYKNYVSK
ncbi:hypothetical protein COV24_01955 [candidate division WWE3 bacterium CG10_big_fil_rev_8_21_14_0_10_32_10]|uniref:Glycosyl transferase family 1 domain-containing protein n=1 Tax=candidate division WWE3 bacterium CG10_big_fil_rev_8_21_14_0_10_32_10 TaxID=1975090 RepID=A0A2H0RB26_UNCKA|nr:MAG: hypothetical protein COV24_01955 [candidate division WWE3 bacterium CG10_big_fil_rev_8_21_14_0_10_32_10]